MGVNKNATPEEIRRAYKDKALRLHPDKRQGRGEVVTPEDRANFQHMKEAYDILSDPQRRELYDKLGETGLKMTEDPASVSPEKIMGNFLSMRNTDRLKLCIFVVGFVGFILLVPILACAKIDDKITISWLVIGIPLWIIDGIVVYLMIYAVAQGRHKPSGEMEDATSEVDPNGPLWLRILNLIQFCLTVLFEVFVALNLDHRINWDWAYVAIPYFVWEGIRAVPLLLVAFARAPPLEPEGEDVEGGSIPANIRRSIFLMQRTEARMGLFGRSLYILQVIYIVLKLDDKTDLSWWGVFWPVYVTLGMYFLKYLAQCIQASAVLAREARLNEGISSEPSPQAKYAGELQSKAMYSCCCGGVYVAMILLTVAKIAGADFSTYIIFIPVFAVAGCLVCCMVCMICCCRGDMDSLNPHQPPEEEEAGEPVPIPSAGAPPTSKRPPSSETPGTRAAASSPPSYGTYQPPAVAPVSPVRPAQQPMTRIDIDID